MEGRLALLLGSVGLLFAVASTFTWVWEPFALVAVGLAAAGLVIGRGLRSTGAWLARWCAFLVGLIVGLTLLGGAF